MNSERQVWGLRVICGDPAVDRDELHAPEAAHAPESAPLNACTDTPLPVLAVQFEPDETPSKRWAVVAPRAPERPALAKCRTLDEAQAAIARRTA